MLRDFSDNAKTELIRLIIQSGTGIAVQITDPAVFCKEDSSADLCSSSVWAEKLGILTYIDGLVSYENKAGEKCAEARRIFLRIFDDVMMIETSYDRKLQDICSRLTELNSEIKTITDNVSAAARVKIDPFVSSGISGNAAATENRPDQGFCFEGEVSTSSCQTAWADESQYASAAVDARTGNAYAQFQTEGGLFACHEDGSIFSPYISAQAGAGVSALELSAQARAANDCIGVYAGAEADILEANADAQIKAAVFNEEGQFSPEAYARFSAEANAAQITGSAGLVIFGADVGITGGISVGVGAHAEIGYTDGRFMLDVGASLGVGVCFGLDIDFDALMEGVSAAVGEAWSAVSFTAADSWEKLEEFWNDLFYTGIPGN